MATGVVRQGSLAGDVPAVAKRAKMSDSKAPHMVSPEDPMFLSRPQIDGRKFFLNGQVREWTGETQTTYSPILNSATGERIEIGCQARMEDSDALEALEAAKAAWNGGQGEWPLMPLQQRIACMQNFVTKLKTKRETIVSVLMWEICKVAPDAAKEFDRTIDYIEATLTAVRDLENSNNKWIENGGIMAQLRHTPIGVMLNLGPFNYPFNETYTTLIPAILMGNTVVMKLPNVGCLAHIPTMEIFAECFPAGVVNFISGAGRTTMPPIMKTGDVDIFAFIGGSKAADALIKHHPHPHRVRFALALDAKNLCVIMPDADLDLTVNQVVAGSLSYNGQRCTALKMIMVHADIADTFAQRLAEAVSALPLGLPWEKTTKITPLPEPNKPGYIADLITDATSKGAKIINEMGGVTFNTIVKPGVLYPCNSEMRVWHEEQFGPLVPVSSFTSLDEVKAYVKSSPFGQQASVFSSSTNNLAEIFDVLSNSVCRINLNTQCQRSPDSLPFTGKKSSANGTLSVTDALKAFSVECMVAAKPNAHNVAILEDVATSGKSSFLRQNYLYPVQRAVGNTQFNNNA